VYVLSLTEGRSSQGWVTNHSSKLMRGSSFCEVGRPYTFCVWRASLIVPYRGSIGHMEMWIDLKTSKSMCNRVVRRWRRQPGYTLLAAATSATYCRSFCHHHRTWFVVIIVLWATSAHCSCERWRLETKHRRSSCRFWGSVNGW